MIFQTYYLKNHYIDVKTLKGPTYINSNKSEIIFLSKARDEHDVIIFIIELAKLFEMYLTSTSPKYIVL